MKESSFQHFHEAKGISFLANHGIRWLTCYLIHCTRSREYLTLQQFSSHGTFLRAAKKIKLIWICTQKECFKSSCTFWCAHDATHHLLNDICQFLQQCYLRVFSSHFVLAYCKWPTNASSMMSRFHRKGGIAHKDKEQLYRLIIG